MFGVDSLQALLLTLHVVPVDLMARARDARAAVEHADLGLTHSCRTFLEPNPVSRSESHSVALRSPLSGLQPAEW